MFQSNNRFASIAMSDDEEEEENNNEDEEDNEQVQVQGMDEAGDTPILHQVPGMALLRLVIRIHTSTSDLWAFKGNAMAAAHDWMPGATALQCAIQAIHKALELADAQISKYYHQQQQQQPGGLRNKAQEEVDPVQRQRQRELQADADIVHVAVQALVRARDKYIQAAERQVQRLEKILQPQWQSRDQAKERLGAERWNNNPNPKLNHARLRQESEAELRQVQDALRSIHDSDLEGLSATAEFLKLRLLPSNRHRYNGQRPEQMLGVHVERLEQYPDATVFGWTFTGSNAQSRVEFFERLFEDTLVKLDFYYSTGTVKTSMEHPRQGKTQLFCDQDQITPDLYAEILKNPRVHTDGQRYQRTENKPAAPAGRGGGGGGFGRGD